MSKASKPPGLMQRLRPRAAPVLDDAADMGTAFGMEMSLAAKAAAAPAAPAQQAPGWLRRLARRGKAAR